ncbi:MAG: HAD-superfamily hydrolase, subfamily variant 3 [Firmicutes bacterium]|nr:HAD-superfamily hydrolase, subfamily variant 3 [Bacillota bacterium]
MDRRQIKAVIFDLDGTLIDSEPIYFETDKKLFAEYGVNYDLAMKNKYIGIGSVKMVEELKAQYQIKDSVETVVEKHNQRYLEIAREKTQVFPEMKRLLELLKEQQYLIAVASGSSPEVIDIVLGSVDLRKFFSVVISAEEVKQGKPAPDIFLEVASQWGIKGEQCLVVEDSRYGVMAAKSAGMYCVAIPYPPQESLDDSYLTADLLFSKGMSEFSAQKTMEWLKG